MKSQQSGTYSFASILHIQLLAGDKIEQFDVLLFDNTAECVQCARF